MSGTDFSLVDVAGWEWDLHGIYSAYMGYFQSYNIAWYDRSWGHLFASFDAFLGFNWPTVVITDARTGRAHIVTRASNIQAFVRMVKTRFGENMPLATDNLTPIVAYEHSQRQLRHVADIAMYRKLHATMPAAMLAALRARVKHGNPKEIARLWHRRDMTFLALDFEWSEKSFVILEMGYATIRSAHLDATGVWPPIPESNYRKGHYIISDYVDKVHNRMNPTFPWDYAWGESQIIAKAKLTEILQALLTSLASPDSESVANSLVLVSHAPSHVLERLQDLKVKLPSNVLIVDVAQFERQIHANTSRAQSSTPSPQFPRLLNQTLPLPLLLPSLNIPVLAPFNNSGNDAFYTLLAFQYLVDPEGTRIPPPKVGKRDGFPMVAPAVPSMMSMNGFGAGAAMPFDSGMGGSRTSRRLSLTMDEFGGSNGGSLGGAPATWQSRLGAMNGSMPSLGGPANVVGTPGAGGGGGGGGGGTGPRGRPPALNSADAGSRSGSMPRSNGAGGSGPSSPRSPANNDSRSNSRPKMRNPDGGSSNGNHGSRGNSGGLHRPQGSTTTINTLTNQSSGARRQDSASSGTDYFQPPKAPFAREAIRSRTSSLGDRATPLSQHSSRNSPASSVPGTPGSHPSITVTDAAGGNADRATIGSRKSTSRKSTTISLNDDHSAGSREKSPKDEKRPQSDLLPISKAPAGTKEKGGGFLASTFKRLSMKP